MLGEPYSRRTAQRYRDRGKKKDEKVSENVYMSGRVYVCVWVCEREREKERERKTEKNSKTMPTKGLKKERHVHCSDNQGTTRQDGDVGSGTGSGKGAFGTVDDYKKLWSKNFRKILVAVAVSGRGRF